MRERERERKRYVVVESEFCGSVSVVEGRGRHRRVAKNLLRRLRVLEKQIRDWLISIVIHLLRNINEQNTDLLGASCGLATGLVAGPSPAAGMSLY